MVGTWNLVSDVNTSADGRNVEPFGPSPRGIAIFDSDGHFAIVISRPDLPKFASNNRMQGTPEENKAIVQGSIGFFGTYAVADGAVIQHVEGATWPSWIGTDQKRTITSGLFTKGHVPAGAFDCNLLRDGREIVAEFFQRVAAFDVVDQGPARAHAFRQTPACHQNIWGKVDQETSFTGIASSETRAILKNGAPRPTKMGTTRSL